MAANRSALTLRRCGRPVSVLFHLGIHIDPDRINSGENLANPTVPKPLETPAPTAADEGGGGGLLEGGGDTLDYMPSFRDAGQTIPTGFLNSMGFIDMRGIPSFANGMGQSSEISASLSSAGVAYGSSLPYYWQPGFTGAVDTLGNATAWWDQSGWEPCFDCIDCQMPLWAHPPGTNPPVMQRSNNFATSSI